METTRTAIPTATEHHRVGSMPLCLALGSADVGRAKVSGRWVFTTWGRNLDPTDPDVAAFLDRTGFAAIHLGAPDRVELIIPDAMVEPVRRIIRR